MSPFHRVACNFSFLLITSTTRAVEREKILIKLSIRETLFLNLIIALALTFICSGRKPPQLYEVEITETEIEQNIDNIDLLFDTMKRYDKLEQIHHQLRFNPRWSYQVLLPF